MNFNGEVRDVLDFWRDAGPKRWFSKDALFDADFRSRFLDLHYAVASRQRDHWLESADAWLAALILLDQFPRNAFRGSAHMFATDPLALAFARTGIERGFDQQIDDDLRAFCYLPFEHSENLRDQEKSVALMLALDAQSIDYAEKHLAIIRDFGRFPHRNAVLGRDTTDKEQAFLEAGGFAG